MESFNLWSLCSRDAYDAKSEYEHDRHLLPGCGIDGSLNRYPLLCLWIGTINRNASAAFFMLVHNPHDSPTIAQLHAVIFESGKQDMFCMPCQNRVRRGYFPANNTSLAC